MKLLSEVCSGFLAPVSVTLLSASRHDPVMMWNVMFVRSLGEAV